MTRKLGKFQMGGFQSWKGITSANHLGATFMSSPQKASDIMVQLLASDRGNTLESLISQFPTKTFKTDDEYYWDVISSNRRNVPLVEARDTDGTVVTNTSGNIGAHNAPFFLVFAEDWFADGEVIVGNLNQVYPYRVLGSGSPEGTNTVYKVEMFTNHTDGCPAERLLLGERFSIDYAPVEKEFSRKAGDVRFSTPVAMRNEWSVIRIHHKVSGALLNKKIAIGIPMVKTDAKGKKTRTVTDQWMHKEDFEVEEQFSEYKNNVLAFGVSNRNANGEYMNFGKSGYVIKTGAGLFEQMEVANTRYINKFSLKVLNKALYDLSASKLKFNERVFTIKTGERGAIAFNTAVLDTVSGWTQFSMDNQSINAVKHTASPLHQNALSAGFQFVEYRAPNGVVVKLDVDPFYDDPVRNKIMHPEGGVAMSYRYDIMYMGTMDQPNISKCQVENLPEMRGYQWGIRDPFTGRTNNMNMSYDEDSATIHKMATTGIVVLDPTRTISLIPTQLQG